MNMDPRALGADDQLQNLHAVRKGTRVFSKAMTARWTQAA